MPHGPLQIDLTQIPDAGLPLRGEIAEDIFELGSDDHASPAGAVRFDARAYLIDSDLVVEGNFSADFELECSRCLEKFVFGVELRGHNLAENLENPAEADLTRALREDILLALPAYPRCEDGKFPRQCPAEGKFAGTDRPPQEEETVEEAPNPWDQLDDLEGLDPKSSD